jgi:hypothetical protein
MMPHTFYRQEIMAQLEEVEGRLSQLARLIQIA